MNHKKLSAISRVLILFSLTFTSLAFAQSSISDADTTAGATTNYTYNFTLIGTDTLFPTERITITFPSVFDISNVLIAGSNTIDGGFDIFNITSTDIVIDRDGTGDTLTVADGTGFEITFGTVTNPTSVGGPHSISLASPNIVTKNASVSIVAGSLDNFTIDTVSSPRTAGTPFNITIRAKDQFDNPVTIFGGTVTISDNTGTISPTTSDFFSSGVRTESVTLTKAQAEVQISVSGGGALGQSNKFNVNPAVLDHFTFDTISSPQTAGTQFNITMTAKDQFENTVTSFTGPATLSDDTGTISPTSTGTFTSGVRAALGVTITQSASNVRITATNGVSSQSNAFNVDPGALAGFAIDSISDQATNTPFPITITAQDANSNTVTGFTGTVDISDSTGTISPPTSGSFVAGRLTENVTITQPRVDDAITVTNSSGSENGTSNQFDVSSTTIDHFRISTIVDRTAGAAFSITVTAEDASNNPVTGFNGTVNLSDLTGTISPTISGSFTTGSWTGNVSITEARTLNTITATGLGKSGTSNLFNVNPDILDHFTFDAINSPQTAGTQFNITMTAQDQFENTVTSFTGPATLSDDTGTITPTSSGTFTSGVRTVGVTITQSASNVRITATSGGVSSQSNFFNVTSQSVQSFTISTISSPQEAGVPFLVTITAKDGPGGTGNTATDFTGTVDLSLNSGTLTPTVSGNFINGVLTGNITVQSLGGSSTKILTVANSANASHTGSSLSFTTNPGTPAGTVTLTPTPNTLPADGSSTSQVTSATIFDSFGNSVGANKSFTVALSDDNLGSAPSPVSTNLSSQLDFNFTASTTGGTVNVSVSSIGGSATGNTNISIGSMNILSISTAPDFVSRGQSAINVQMAVQNLSASAITQLDPNLTFTGPGGDRTSQYTVNRTDGVTSIPAQGQATFTWDVAVSPSASLELITIDGSISGEINSTPVSAQGAATPDTWTVQLAAQISADNVTSPLDTVVLGQQGNMVTVQISNPTTAGGASAVIDDIRLKFLKNGVEDKTSDFPFTPLGGNPTSVPAGGAPLNFDFTVNVGASADTGNYVVDFEVDAHDTNSVGLSLQDLNATTTHAWTVKGAPTLQILSLTPQPVSTFRAGQTDNWTVRMAVRNNGPDAIDLDFSVANTFIRFIIGVDVTNQYTIIQPTQLAVAGTNRLNGGATDTFDFIVDATGTTTGTATITGRVEGTDVSTSNTIFDDTQDGGTGVVIITSQSETVSIANTTANTPNVLQSIGIVNTGQTFQVSVDIDNDLDEPVENVLVQLMTDGPSQIAQNQLTIPLIAANNSEIINFSVTADGTPNSIDETFTAQILSATGQQTQQPAPIAPSANNTADFRIQTAADLQIQFTKIDTFPSTDEVFVVEATVSNSGESLVDNSGTVDLTIPAGYTVVSGNLNNMPFTVNLPVQWQVRAPAAATSPQSFAVAINQRPLEFNTDTFAAVSVSSDAQNVQTRETDLAILSFSVISPPGATNNTLSTDQRFTLRATLSATQNIESVQADLTLPQDYQLAAGLLSQTLSPGQTQVDWQIDAPGQPHNPRTIQVQMQGFDSGSVIADTTAQFNLTAILKATMDFDHFENNTIQTVRLSVGQTSTLTALVKNIGQAGVIGAGTLVLDLAGTGINAMSPLSQTFNPDVPVVWNIQAPAVPTQPQRISVTMLSVPQDQNTNDLAAFNQPTERSIEIVTGDAGGLTIDNVSVSAPQGAIDDTLSTEQQFTLTADYSWQNTENLSASIVLPTGYGASSLTQNLISLSGDQSLQWQITAPVNATPQEFIRFEASGTDISSGQQVSAQPDSLPFTVVGKARLNLNAAITAPASATDRIVTINQPFTVTASLPNSGQAALAGEDSVQITLPVGYTTTSQTTQALSPAGQATWIVLAPQDPTAILDMQVEIITRGATDENTNQLPPLTPVPPRITIPVQTQAIGLNLTVLDQRKPTTIVRGGTNSVFGLRFKNNSDTDIDIQSIDLSVKDNQNNDIAPNSVFTNLSVVDYDNNSISFESVSPPGANPLTVNFSPALRIPPSQVQSIEFLVSIAAQTEGNHFLLSIDSPQDDIRAIDVGSTDQVDIRDDSLGFKITGALGAGVVGLTDPELEASFFNYPNPFGQNGRATTFFNYNLTQASNVTIRIYTLLGELVKTYQFQSTDPEGAAGTHFEQVFWDGANEKGQGVLNGVYVAVLITNSGKAMTKIAIAR